MAVGDRGKIISLEFICACYGSLCCLTLSLSVPSHEVRGLPLLCPPGMVGLPSRPTQQGQLISDFTHLRYAPSHPIPQSLETLAQISKLFSSRLLMCTWLREIEEVLGPPGLLSMSTSLKLVQAAGHGLEWAGFIYGDYFKCLL